MATLAQMAKVRKHNVRRRRCLIVRVQGKRMECQSTSLGGFQTLIGGRSGRVDRRCRMCAFLLMLKETLGRLALIALSRQRTRMRRNAATGDSFPSRPSGGVARSKPQDPKCKKRQPAKVSAMSELRDENPMNSSEGFKKAKTNRTFQPMSRTTLCLMWDPYPDRKQAHQTRGRRRRCGGRDCGTQAKRRHGMRRTRPSGGKR
mmetsp:Transcript_3353/g.6830  ORF Transcript_3353/g.6830 Transcript_3353/m.6830 type:complete len:203 (+) Transcript_3353:109-717(+)